MRHDEEEDEDNDVLHEDKVEGKPITQKLQFFGVTAKRYWLFIDCL
jgi:hypothetical protein